MFTGKTDQLVQVLNDLGEERRHSFPRIRAVLLILAHRGGCTILHVRQDCSQLQRRLGHSDFREVWHDTLSKRETEIDELRDVVVQRL